MHYLLNKNLSFDEKGLIALLLHLHEGDIKLTNETLKHYCEYCLTPIEIVSLLLRIRAFKYIEITNNGDKYTISIVREDNEIKE